jgi:hypothetical protein
MKRKAFLLLALLLFGQTLALSQSPDPSNRSDKDKMTLNAIEGQVIQVLLDGLGSAELGNKIMVMSYDPGENLSPDTITAHILAWFKHSPNDRVIIVSYFLVPWFQKYDDRFFDNQQYSDGAKYRAFLQKIVSDKKITDTENIKQLEIPLPVGLWNDIWFDKLCMIYEYGLYSLSKPIDAEKSKVTIEWMTFDSQGPYYQWGIKFNGIEHIQGHSFRDGTLMLKIEYDILKPIARAILEHETPKSGGMITTNTGRKQVNR